MSLNALRMLKQFMQQIIQNLVKENYKFKGHKGIK